MTTTPAPVGSPALAAYAISRLPSAAVRRRSPWSATVPARGGSGGTESSEWHMPSMLPPVPVKRFRRLGRMPTLTRTEAAGRAALLRVHGYDIDLDLTAARGSAHFASTTT